jgi:hypothetical protein
MHQFWTKFAVAAITSCSCLCLCLLKIVYRSECIDENVGKSGNILQPVVTTFTVTAVLSFCANGAYLFWLLFVRGWTLVAAICSKWQPLYFIMVSMQKLVLWAIVIPSFSTSTSIQCLEASHQNQILVSVTIWHITILCMSVWIFGSDLDADFSPAWRRRIYAFLSACSISDAVGSYVWGNMMASQVSVRFGSFKFVLDNQITSCITSQVVIALHFLYSSCRSQHGLAWAYASLIFELDDFGKAFLSDLNGTSLSNLKSPEMNRQLNGNPIAEHAVALPAEEASTDSIMQHARIYSRLRLRLLQFQKRHVALCRIFVIPCIQCDGVGSSTKFALKRPAFDLKCLRPLQHLADMYPKFYICFMILFLAIPSVASAIFLQNGQDRGITTLILNFSLLVGTLGFISSKRHNLDKVAVKEIATSFRFAICALLLAQFVLLDARRVWTQSYAGITSPTQPAAVAVFSVLFCTFALIDCSPHFSAMSQVICTVIALDFL